MNLPLLRVLVLIFLGFASVSIFAFEAKTKPEECKNSISDKDFDWAPKTESGLSLWGGPDDSGHAFLFLGSFHSFDPSAAHISEIRRFFAKFRPTLVLYEGGTFKLSQNAEEAIRQGGEMGFTQWLASSCRIKHMTFEPSFKQEITGLLRDFSAEQLKLYYIARLIPQHNAQGTTKKTVDDYLLEALNDPRWKEAGLDNVTPRSVTEIELALKSAVPNIANWRQLEYKHTAPIDRFNETEKSILNKIASKSSFIRETELIKHVRDGLRKGDRVFVIAGTSHMLGVMPRLKFDDFRKK
jgi:hypothetical protein